MGQYKILEERKDSEAILILYCLSYLNYFDFSLSEELISC